MESAALASFAKATNLATSATSEAKSSGWEDTEREHNINSLQRLATPEEHQEKRQDISWTTDPTFGKRRLEPEASPASPESPESLAELPPAIEPAAKRPKNGHEIEVDAVLPPSPVVPVVTLSTSDTPSVQLHDLSPSHQIRPHAPEKQLDRMSSNTSERAGTSSDLTGQQSIDFRIVHEVICYDKFHRDETLFATSPTWESSRESSGSHGWKAHLTFTQTIRNIAAFMKESQDISFLVFRYYRCSDSNRWGRHHTKTTSDTGVRYDETIAIVSPSLQAIFDDVSRCVPDKGSAEKDGPKNYSADFFYHHRAALNDRHSQLESMPRSELTAILGYVQATYGTRFGELDMSIAQGFIQADDLAAIFCPNQVVISRKGVTLEAFVLRTWPWKRDTGVLLECWQWGFDGGSLRRKEVDLDITKLSQSVMKIRDLEVFPASFASETEIEYLQSRGVKIWNMRYPSFVAYEGWDGQKDYFYAAESRWMVDYRTYKQMHPTAKTFHFTSMPKLPFDQWPDTLSLDLEMPPGDCLLAFPATISAFSFKKKAWSILRVDHVRRIKWNTEAFDRLVLPAKTKDMVKSLVMVRASPKHSKQRKLLNGMQDDIIRGKGNGLIMLLHGPPGTGKTLTAGIVAEIAKMPLYSVTCGDIGTKPEAVEKYLGTVLMLGKRWNCILLLDEADAFLEERSMSDLERNSLVSVFLRTLEYYDGILILTSNRVGTFDEAFTSRIQVALTYGPLTASSRRKIWQNFLDMVQTDKDDVDMDDLLSHFDELVRGYEMNGRQIRNVFTTARQLAIFKEETLVWDHLEQALQSVSAFNKYRQGLHGHTDDEWAREEKLR
ncbi:hypothetical protein PFICI_04776 [Pestalotiopsis fici W106-1]|uniref:AAA+ ATPase domain-containing protein n=1 Tax=Pestalotiopsis fici (strain W106-1 / CGMCC3.15140) TaxID=1229662 RepID=W3XA11_PESFW|nr:uncharacterized protein PFICI_04776 [Pestalotiopsis fici W106-1]ETS82900.1 hypothetical protein PFICI_04776 [Pestalotiopsis fici W106-1]